MVILGLVIYFLYQAVANNEKFDEQFLAALNHAFRWQNVGYLLMLFSLIFINWACEAGKWKVLVSKLEEISFWESFKGVLAGLAMSFVSTTNAGAYFGRVWHLRSTGRYEMLGGMILNSLSQNAITYFFSGIGLVYYLNWKGVLANQWFAWVVVIWVVVALLTLLVIFRAVIFIKWFERFPKIYKYLHLMASYDLKEILTIIAISALRYCTYFTQFSLILILFGVDLPIQQLLAGISLVYLAKTIIPNFSFLTDLGIREFSAIYLLGEEGFGVPDATIISATLSIWLINIVFPVAVGAIFTWQMRISQKTYKEK